MKELFKQKLLDIRSPQPPRTFSEALFGDCFWSPKKARDQESSTPVIATREESFHPEFTFNAQQADIIFKNKQTSQVKVLFITEKFRNWDESSLDFKSGFINELIMAFPLQTAELFERMIKAMNLTSEEVIILPLIGLDDKDCSSDVFKVAERFRPEVVITLGSSATTGILKSSDRLSLIHGQFFSRKHSDQSTFQVVPLFHPSIIETNQNMKKTAWSDMQKIMKYLKKLP